MTRPTIVAGIAHIPPISVTDITNPVATPPTRNKRRDESVLFEEDWVAIVASDNW